MHAKGLKLAYCGIVRAARIASILEVILGSAINITTWLVWRRGMQTQFSDSGTVPSPATCQSVHCFRIVVCRRTGPPGGPA